MDLDDLTDDWLGSELADILVGTPTGRSDALDASIEALAKSEPLDMERAFELLQCLRNNDGRILGRLPVRATASPLTPAQCTSYVVCRRLCDANASAPDGESIAVSFQSILNSEVWWSPSDKYRNEGVASRPMSRCTRPGARGTSKSASDNSSNEGDSADGRQLSHGFRGRMYTLVARAPGAAPGRTKRARGKDDKSRRYVAVGDVSIVHAWRAADEEQAAFHKVVAPRPKKPTAAFQMPPAVEEENPDHRDDDDDLLPADFTPRNTEEDVRVAEEILSAKIEPDEPRIANKRPRCFGPLSGDALRNSGGPDVLAVDKTLRVKGDVHVDGFIFGQLATTPQAADYAEWFEWADIHLTFDDKGDVVDAPPPGSVAQLRSPEQRLTLDTSGSGPCLIVSTSPSVAAGLPTDPREADRGALVAFLGQVPVRCRGVVRTGDQLVPSGLHDGTAIAHHWNDNDVDALGIAMEATIDVKQDEDDPEVGLLHDEQETTILSFVRWNHAVRRELKDEMGKVVTQLHSRFLSLLVYATAFLAAGVLALLSTLVVVDLAKLANDDDAALKRHELRLRTWIYFLGAVGFALDFGLVGVFTSGVPNLTLLVLFFLITIAAIVVDIVRHDNFTNFFVLGVALCYHAIVCISALKLRRDQTQPNAIIACSPACQRWAPRLLPFCCIFAIFACIFVT